jgi:hypothetical protein
MHAWHVQNAWDAQPLGGLEGLKGAVLVAYYSLRPNNFQPSSNLPIEMAREAVGRFELKRPRHQPINQST